MKGSLCLLLALVVQSCTSIRVWESGKEYLFKEEASIHVGTQDLNNTVTGFRFMSDVKVQVQDDKMVVTIDNIQEAHYAQSYPPNSWPYRLINDKKELREGEKDRQYEDIQLKSKYFNSIGYENGKTFIVHLENGLAKKIELPSGLSVNGKNMMKAIAAMLQVDMNERPEEDMQMWMNREKTLHGECDYEYVSTKDATLKYREVTKTVSHLKDCRKRNFRGHDMSEARTCNIADEDKMDGESIFKPYGYDRSYEKEEDKKRRLEDKHDHIYGEKVYREMYHPEPLNSGSMTTFLMKEVSPDNYQLKKIFSTGMIALRQFFGTDSNDIDSDRKGITQMSLTNRTLYLKEVKSLGGLESVQSPETEENLEFEWADDKAAWNDDFSVEDLKKKEASYFNGYTMLDESQKDIMEGLKSFIKNYVEEMLHYHDIDSDREEVIEKLHKYNMGYIITYFRALNYDSFMILKDYYLNLERNTPKKNILSMLYEKFEDKAYEKDVFFEILPWTGTWPAALAVRDIVKNNDLNCDIKNAKLLTSVPFHVDGVKTLVDEWYKLVTDGSDHLKWQFTRNAVELSYANLVRKTCNDLETLEECYKTLKIEEFIKKFDSLNVEDHNLLNHYMLVFYNFRDSEILEQKLRSIIFKKESKKYDNEIRAMAVRALRDRVIRRGLEREFFLPLVLNRDEHHEVRIAAFDAIMRGFPSSTTFAKIMKYMIYETDYEVFNYIYTAYEKYAHNNNEPCMKPVHEYAKYYLSWWKNNIWIKPKYSFGLSKTYMTNFVKDKYGYSESLDVKIIGSHRATTPLSMSVEWRNQRFEHMTSQIIGLKLRMEGVAEKIVQKIKYLLIEQKNIKFDLLKQILSDDLQIRERKDVPAKLSFFVTYRDSIVFEFHLQDSELMKRQQNINFEMMKQMFFQMKDLTALYDMRKHFGLAIMSFNYEQPTEFGVPLLLEDEAYSMLNLVGKLRKDKDWMMDTDVNMRMSTVHYTKFSIIHPDNKHEYMIKKKMNQKMMVDTGLNVDIDYDTKRVKLSLKVPQEEIPVIRLNHARTYIKTHDNKLTRTQMYLKKSCPTCLQTQVVTKGKEWRRGGVIVPKYLYDLAHVYGMELSGKYFDCELPESYSPGRMFWSYLKTFSPMNKEPKNLLGMLISGYLQLESYIFFWPRAESCGLRLKWGKSFDQPIDRILLDVDFRDLFTEKTKKYNEILGDKRLSLGADLIFDGQFNRTHHIDLMLKYETEYARTLIDLEIRRKPFVYQGKMFKDFPIIFRMDTFTEDQRPWRETYMKDVLSTRTHRLFQKIELTWGRPDLKIRIDGRHETTADAKDALRRTWYFNECIRQHELLEWRDTERIPKTDACYFTLVDLYTVRNYKWDIQATNLEEWMVMYYRKAGALIKAAFFPFWDFKPEYLRHEISPQQPRIRIETFFHPREDQFDLSLELDKEVSRFNGINYGWWSWNEEPYQMLDKFRMLTNARIRPQFSMYLYSHRIISNCFANRATVRTFDNVTYDFRDAMNHGCYSLLTADCELKPTFAVFMKKDEEKAFDGDMPLDLLTYIEDVKIEISPRERKQQSLRHHHSDAHQHSRDHSHNDVTLFNQDWLIKQDFDVKINGKDYDLRIDDYLLYSKEVEPMINKPIDDYRFRVFRTKSYPNSIIIDYSPQLMIVFDGNSVQNTVGPHIKGRQCGMCGDLNMSFGHELIDPKMCLMKDGKDMAKAWTLDKKFCSKPISKPDCTKTINFENMGYKF